MNPSPSPPILIFTGGHHTGALEVAKILLSRGIKIIWFGHRHSMWGDRSVSAEFTEVSISGVRFIDLRAGKFYRTFHPLKLIRIPWGFFQSVFYLFKLKLLYRARLKGIVSFGGYLAVPVTICGYLLGLPIIAHEQTMVSGMANRLIARLAKKIAVSWSSGVREFPSRKSVFTGSLIRPQIITAARNPSFPVGKPVIYVTGGKQGSHQLNVSLFGALPELLKKYTVVHQTGASTIYRDYSRAFNFRFSLPVPLRDSYIPIDYLPADQAAANLAKALVVVSRSGAHITAELAYLSTRSVVIPLPRSSHNEQEINARYLVSHRLAILLPQSQLTPASLVSAIDQASKLQPKNIDLPHNGVDNLVKLISTELL